MGQRISKDRTLTTLDEIVSGISPTEPHDAHGVAVDSWAPARIAHFVLLGWLGGGGMGMVFSAFDERLERKVALKVLRPRAGARGSEQRAHAQKRLLREARSLARLSHPNVVAVYEVGTLPGGDVFIAMEFVKGQTLRAWQDEAQRSWREIVRMYAQAGAGLAAAHQADIVHRDFKPDNVLVGEDGRPRVLDFGLARLHDEPDGGPRGHDAGDDTLADDTLADDTPAADTPASAAPEPLTRAGTIMGTPGYMAPEQARRGEHDARVDQFSFCVALYEALYGQRPYPDRAFWPEARRRNHDQDSDSGNDPEAARRARPERIHAAWLHAALERGLALSPGDRFASMDDLLVELARDRVRPRRLALALVAATALGLMGTAVAFSRTSAPADPCPVPRDAFAGTWDDTQKQRVRDALLATNQPFAGQAWRALENTLDRHAAVWMAAHRDACRATHVRHEQSEAILDLRMECLDTRKREIGAVAEVMASSAARAVERVDEVVDSLGDIAVCANTRALRLGVQLPRDADLGRRIADARAGLATGSALFAAGDFTGAEVRIQAAAHAGDKLDYAPLEAEIMYLRGRLDLERGHIDDAVRALRQAVDTAVAARHDELVADAWIAMALDAGPHIDKPAGAHEWIRHAEAALRRLDHADDPRAVLVDAARGRIQAAEGRFAEAADTFARAIDRARARWGDAHPRIVKMLHNRANALTMLGQAKDARALYERALELGLELWGPAHPHVADTRLALGLLMIEQLGDLDGGAAELDKARHIYAAAHGNDALDVGHVELALCQLAMYRGQYASGLPHAERALAIYDRHLGSDHPRRGEALTAAGALRFMTGDVAGSLADYRAALAILEPALGAEHVNVGILHSNIGESLLALGQDAATGKKALEDEAIVEFSRALDIMGAALGPENINLALPLKGLGLAALAAGLPRRALDPLERALALRADQSGDPQELAEIQWALARTLAALGRQPRRRRHLASRARDSYRALGPNWRERARDITRWLENNP